MTLYRVNSALIVLLIVLTSTCMLMPAVKKVLFAAHRTQTVDKMKSMGLAMVSYHDAFKQLPPAFDRALATFENEKETVRTPVSVHVHLLPYLDQQAIYATHLADGNGNHDAIVSAFQSPMDGSLTNGAGVQCFAANLRVFSSKGGRTAAFQDMPPLASIEPGGRTLESISRGGSLTIAFATKLARCSEGGSRYAADPTSPFAAFFGQNAANSSVHYSTPTAPFQWAPRGDECLCKPLMAQTYAPYPIVTGWCDGTVRIVPGEVHPQRWNEYLHATAD